MAVKRRRDFFMLPTTTTLALRQDGGRELLRELGVGEFLVEFVDTTCRVHKFHLAGEERVAVCGNLHFDERILLAVFPGGRFFRISAGAAQESFVRRNVFEHHEAVIGRMDVFFHISCTKNFYKRINHKIRAAKVAY